MSFLSFLLLRKVIVDCDEGPGQVVAVVDTFEPCSFSGETSSNMEIPDCTLNTRKLVDVMDGLRRSWAGGVGVGKCEVGKHVDGGRDNVG